MPRVLPTPVFPSILCGTDNGPGGIAARRQAAWLAEPDGSLDVVAEHELTHHGAHGLADRCEGFDLLVLAFTPKAQALACDLRIPALLARWCPEGRDVTDRILVAVGDRAGATRASHLAARLAARHGGTVSVVAAPRRSYDLDRALAASGRIILSTAGRPPRVLGEIAPPELAVPRAAAKIAASLLVLGVGADTWDSALATDVARRANCSVLTVPVSVPAVRRFSGSLPRSALVGG